MARIDLAVPFAEKDEAKKLGARWDPEKTLWYVPERIDPAPFQRWMLSDRDGGHGPQAGIVAAPSDELAPSR